VINCFQLVLSHPTCAFKSNLRRFNTVSCVCVIERSGGEEQIVATGGFDGRVAVWDVRKTRNSRQ